MIRLALVLFIFLQTVVAAAQEGNLVRGLVVTEGTGAPVQGARVAIGGLPAHVRTDASGRFEIRVPFPVPGPPLIVTKPGFARVTVPRTAAGQDLSVRLAPSAALTVHVIDQRGEPVAGTNIRISCGNGTSTGPSNDLGERRDGQLHPGRCGVNVGNVGAWLRIAGEPTIDQLTRAFEQLQKLTPEANSAAKIDEMAVDLRAGEEAAIVALDTSPRARPTVSVLGEARRLPPGKGSVRGRISGPGRRPVEGARVTIGSAEGSLTTFSSASGEYAFNELPAGRFRVQVAKAGLTSREFGQPEPGTPGRDVALRDGERIGGIDVALTRGSAISGVVTGESGEPVEGVGVQLFRYDSGAGRTNMIASLTPPVPTDDRGRFRIPMVPPGSYYVGAGGFGARRSEGPVFYPGRVVIADAQAVQVDAGQDITAVDIPFNPAIGVRVHGRVIGPTGPIVDGIVQLTGYDPQGGPVLPRTSELDSGGFEFLNMPPGTFALAVRSPASALVSVVVKGGQVTRSQVPPTQFGRAVVTIAATPPPPIVITTSSGSTLSGRIILEGAADGVTPSSFRLSAVAGGQIAAIANDWSFRMTGLGEPTLFSLAAPQGWWLKSLRIEDMDAADAQVSFGGPEASREDVIAVFSRTAAQITGSVANEKGRALNYSVVVFPVDSRGWFRGSRYVQVGRPNQSGLFSVGMPPGEYWIAAVDSLGAIGPATLNSILPSAVRLTAGESERLQKDLRLVRLPK